MLLCSAAIKVWNFFNTRNTKITLFFFLLFLRNVYFFVMRLFHFYILVRYCVQFEFIALDIGFIASEIYLLKHYFEKSTLNPFLNTFDKINYLVISLCFSLLQI